MGESVYGSESVLERHLHVLVIIVWLKNDFLQVFFDETRGGMPVKDSFGFLRASAIEIAYQTEPPFFQSLNDENPHIRQYKNRVVASGVMKNKKGEVVPHTYSMTAMLENDNLNVRYDLNVARTEGVIRSKIWVFVQNPPHVFIKNQTRWMQLYLGEQPKSLTLFGGRLEISGGTTPPVYAQIYKVQEYQKYEMAYGWARELLQKGKYSGELTLKFRSG